jgi:beta-carotene ketolase (CrtO type)
MADAAFDAVIIGGGTKSLVTAIYLAKYGGMTVGVFERRHELGGGLSSTEASAPGFIGDTHATNVSLDYYIPIEDDFPDFLEKGGKRIQWKGCAGAITREKQKCYLVYNSHDDPNQEHSAHEIARSAGEKDAETYLKIWEYAQKADYFGALADEWLNVRPLTGEPGPLDKWYMDWFKKPDCPIDLEWTLLSPIVAAQQLFDTFGLPLIWLRRALANDTQIVEPMGAKMFLHWMLAQPFLALVVGGTHSVAHAYARILLENGGKFFTHSHVDKIIIENGKAKGVRLQDGTMVEARKMVLSGVDPQQLCFKLLGEQYLSQRVIRKVRSLQGGHGAITWYTWAAHEPAKFKAADFNPDINETYNVALGSEDPDIWWRDYYQRCLGTNPSIESKILYHQYAGVDKSRAPERKLTFLTEQFVAPAPAFSEQEWMKFKKSHAEDVIREMQEYAPNITWDNIIGYDPQTPYDIAARLINMPWGDPNTYNNEAWRPIAMRPITEFGQHRICDIKGLYGTGEAWFWGGGACNEGYRAYKVIAEDFGLRKPWEEKGRSY